MISNCRVDLAVLRARQAELLHEADEVRFARGVRCEVPRFVVAARRHLVFRARLGLGRPA